MQKPTLILLLVALCAIAAGVYLLPGMLAEAEAPVMRWSTADEIDGLAPDAELAVAGDPGADAFERASVEPAAAPMSSDPNEDRVDVLLRGRVVDKYAQPVAAARVWLEFGRNGGGFGRRGNRQRRVPDAVESDSEGRFAFQGQAFRNLRVTLQVQHGRYALGVFDKDLGTVGGEVDLGDLVLRTGGEVRGRVTDLDGNGIPDAELSIEPQGRNQLRWLQGRDDLLPAIHTDRNGYYSYAHLNAEQDANEWALTATAKMHQEGRSEVFAVEEDQVVDVPDIRLGPGYELGGFVRNARGEPIANADVALRGDRPRDGTADAPGGGRRGGGGRNPFGWGREHRTRTDAQGHFFLEHLPGAQMQLDVSAEGYLDFAEEGIDPVRGQVLNVTLQEGLFIAGLVQNPDGSPVTLYAVRTVRLRGLPDPNAPNIDLRELQARIRSGEIDDATRNELRRQMEQVRQTMDRPRGRSGPGSDQGGPGQGGPGQGGPGQRGPGQRGGGRDAARPDSHPDGRFVARGLQEGVYEVSVDSPEHAYYRSAEIELRVGAPAPTLTIALDRGVFVAGVVRNDRGDPVAGASVELRAETDAGGSGGGRRGGRNNGAQDGSAPDFQRMAREFARQMAGAQNTLEARTDEQGLFVIKHAVRGNYRLQASARGLADDTTEPFELITDRSGFELRLGLLGSLVGTVRGMLESEAGQVRAGAVIVGEEGGPGAMFGRGRGRGGNGFRTVDVAADGSYRIDDLTPGNYVVRSWIGSPQQLMRELAPQFFTGGPVADVAVRGGEPTRFDLTLSRPQVGSVTGTVLHNGVAAAGFQVELTRQDDGADAAPPPAGPGGGPGGPGARRMANFGRTFNATVAASGQFAIGDVPAGLYRMRVQSGRRGGVLHEEVVQVLPDAPTERTLVLQTCSLRGTFTRADSGDPKELAGRISLLPGQTVVPDNLNAWLRQNPGFDARVRDGGFAFDALPSGSYLLVVQLRGREVTAQPVVLQGDQELTVAAGAVTANAPNSTGGPNSQGR